MSDTPASDSPASETRASETPAAGSSSSLKCPHCGSPRLTTAEEPCWSCHVILPAARLAIPPHSRYAREAQAPLPALNPGLILFGFVYSGCVCASIVFVVYNPLITVVSVALAVPALLMTLARFSKRHAIGLPVPVSDVILTFLNYLGILPAIVASLTMIAFFLSCGFFILDGILTTLGAG